MAIKKRRKRKKLAIKPRSPSGIMVGGIIFTLLIIFLTSMVLLLRTKFISDAKIGSPATYYNEKIYERPAFLPTPDPQSTTVLQYKIPIIMYHYIENVKDKGDLVRKRLATAPVVFENHLRQLKEAGYETFYVRDVPDIIAGKTFYSTKSVILSFDDGYDDFYSDVFPLLKKYHMRATFYPIYDFIGKKGYVTKVQMKELIDSGLVEIGSHTLSHSYLKTAPDTVAKKQIFESKRKLEEDYNIRIDSFAYPYGAMNPQVIQYVKDAGYKAAVAVISGTGQSTDNLFYLSRIRPEHLNLSAVVASIEKITK